MDVSLILDHLYFGLVDFGLDPSRWLVLFGLEGTELAACAIYPGELRRCGHNSTLDLHDRRI
jgi:hypothetical protein